VLEGRRLQFNEIYLYMERLVPDSEFLIIPELYIKHIDPLNHRIDIQTKVI
jgi:hypothetical protein